MISEIYQNPSAREGISYSAAHRHAINPEAAAQVRAQLRAWPMYAATPLHSLPELARELGVAQLWAKDESLRQPLRSFKGLGGAYALAEVLCQHLADRSQGKERPTHERLWRGEFKAQAAQFPVCAVTDGNHGRSLAWAAQAFGTPCRIYVPKAVSQARRALIAQFGAEIIEVNGNYEDALAQASDAAQRNNWTLIQDTSFVGYEEHCRRIMHGYTLLSEEARQQFPPAQIPTHVFVQVGCGGLAAAVVADMAVAYGKNRPKFIMVQSREADCLYKSLQAGGRVEVGGAHATIMIGIAVGEVSLLAWDILRDFSDFAVRIDDDAARAAMRRLARPSGTDPALPVGETGVAGVAALMSIHQQAAQRQQLGLGPDSRVLVVLTEAPLDTELYQSVVTG
jgi:diaminopropionate ammonia-lyase